MPSLRAAMTRTFGNIGPSRELFLQVYLVKDLG